MSGDQASGGLLLHQCWPASVSSRAAQRPLYPPNAMPSDSPPQDGAGSPAGGGGSERGGVRPPDDPVPGGEERQQGFRNGKGGEKRGSKSVDQSVDQSVELPHSRVPLPEQSVKEELKEAFEPLRALLFVEDDPFEEFREDDLRGKVLRVLYALFPILDWGLQYRTHHLLGDIIAGLTIASLAVPQNLGYAGLANVPPINGLYSSFIPPLVYAVIGSSRHMVIGPTAVVSLLLGNLSRSRVNPNTDPELYLQFAFTATFFSGIIQAGMGLLRLGWVVDLLSHAVIVGFVSGAAITIALQQLKGLLGYTSFTVQSDIISVLTYIFSNLNQFNWRSFLIGICFLGFLISLKYMSRHSLNRVFFFLNALGPLICVTISIIAVFLTKCNQPPYNVATVKKMPKGLNLGSIQELLLTGQQMTDALAVGAIVALVSITEAIAIARVFAAVKGYYIDGNKEMLACGAMNICGSFTSSIATSGSFSRSAVNYHAGANTALSNIIMSLVVLITLVAITPVFEYLPIATLSAIIINAVLTLFDLRAMIEIWKTDKVDVLVLAGTFLGVLFVSVEVGLLIGISISMIKILVLVTRPRVAVLGLIPGTDVYRNVKHYKNAEQIEGLLILRIDAPILFSSASYLRERVLALTESYFRRHSSYPTNILLEFTPVTDMDTTGVHSMEELLRILRSKTIQLAICNPPRIVLGKMQMSGLINEIGEDKLFLSVHEAVKLLKEVHTPLDDTLSISDEF